eukprot:555986_1
MKNVRSMNDKKEERYDKEHIFNGKVDIIGVNPIYKFVYVVINLIEMSDNINVNKKFINMKNKRNIISINGEKCEYYSQVNDQYKCKMYSAIIHAVSILLIVIICKIMIVYLNLYLMNQQYLNNRIKVSIKIMLVIMETEYNYDNTLHISD